MILYKLGVKYIFYGFIANTPKFLHEEKYIHTYGIRDPSGLGLTHVKSWFVHKIKRLSDDPNLDVPALKHKLSFKDGKVDIADLTRADGVLFKLGPDGKPNAVAITMAAAR